MKHKLTYLFCCCYLFFLSTITAQENNIKLITKKTEFVAGESVVLNFITGTKTSLQLYCSNSYGSTIINSVIKNETLSFTIPSHFSTKKGIVNWQLLANKNSLSGFFNIKAKAIPVLLETYIGPPSIEAGGIDFTMFVVIPTDNLDNPLKENTPVNIQQQFLSEEKKAPVFTKNLIAYKNIYSPLKSGRIILSSSSFALNSKEYDVNSMPAIGTDFTITAKRNHDYADGNQITTFATSVIKDQNNNIISDGSFVDFFIKNKKGNILKTSGKTINGVAFAKIIHPEYEDNWSVKAYIVGIAESKELLLSFKKVITNFTVTFSNKNRNIRIGPLQSFMNQMIPDGLKVSLSIFKDKKIVDNLVKKSLDGYVNFELDANIYKNGTYNLEIETAGILQTFKSKKLW